jgi:hypothetical protein
MSGHTRRKLKMTNAKRQTHASGGGKGDRADFHRRRKLAGLDGELPEDQDQFRLEFARTIALFVNNWRGCPEMLCRRNRGCMAPNIGCTNAPPISREEHEREWPKVKTESQVALKQLFANHPAEVAAIEAKWAAKAEANRAAVRAAKGRDKRSPGV